MKSWRILVAARLAMSFCSCDELNNPLVPCLHPLNSEADKEFAPILLGSWTDKEADVTFAFERQGNSAYKLTVSEPKDEKQVSGEFEVHLVRLGSPYFLDFCPEAPKSGDCFYRLHLLQARSLARVTVAQERVQLRFLDSDWLKMQMDNKSVQLDSDRVGGDVIITATTEELQAFADRYASDDDAFANPLELHPANPASEEGEQNAEHR